MSKKIILRKKWNLPAAIRDDATVASIMDRQLTKISRDIQIIEYADLKARNFIPLESELGPNDKTFVYYEADKLGECVFVSDLTNTLPRAVVKMTERIVAMYDIGMSYGWGIIDMQRRAAIGGQLPTLEAESAREITEEKIDEILSLGDAARGILGFINRTDTVTFATPNGASTFPQWRTKTADEIVRDVAGMHAALKTNTLGKCNPTTLLVSDQAYSYLSVTRLDGTATTVKKYILDSFDNLKTIEPWSRLNAAGAGPSGRAILFQQDPKVISAAIPREFETHDAQYSGLQVSIPTSATVGGAICRKPGWICYADNIS